MYGGNKCVIVLEKNWLLTRNNGGGWVGKVWGLNRQLVSVLLVWVGSD